MLYNYKLIYLVVLDIMSLRVPRSALFDNNQVIQDIAEMSIRKEGSRERDSTGETGMIHGRVSTHKLKKFIVASIVQPAYVEDIRDVLSGRYRWRKIAMLLFVSSLILSATATALTFAVAYENSSLLGLIAGIVNIIASVVSHFSLIAKGESKRMTGQANEILKQLDIDGVPDIESDRTTKELQKYENDNVIASDNLNNFNNINLDKELCEVVVTEMDSNGNSKKSV